MYAIRSYYDRDRRRKGNGRRGKDRRSGGKDVFSGAWYTVCRYPRHKPPLEGVPMSQEFSLSTERQGFTNVTSRVGRIVAESGVADGICT